MDDVVDRTLEHAVREALDRANRLDLSAIKRKLTDEQHGLGWDSQRAEDAELLYRRFLAIVAAHDGSEHRVVPPCIVDDFWHQHILDTRKYAIDSDAMFGRFLHHFPYFGMRGPDDERALYAAGTWTLAQFQQHFGDSIGQLLESSSRTSCGSCSSCRSS